MEYLQVFDENKKALNEKIDRKKKKTLKDGKHFMIVLIFIQNDKGEFLIQKTSKEKGSIYAITGGHVEYKDSSLNTALKEVKEELGIDLDQSEIQYVDVINDFICFCDIYYVRKNLTLKDLRLQKEEVEDIFWYEINDILNLIEENKFRKTNIKPFKKVIDYISVYN